MHRQRTKTEMQCLRIMEVQVRVARGHSLLSTRARGKGPKTSFVMLLILVRAAPDPRPISALRMERFCGISAVTLSRMDRFAVPRATGSKATSNVAGHK